MIILNDIEEVKIIGQIQSNSLINADCLEAMKYIESKSIDMILCDLPYGTTACKWDVVIPFDLLWEQYSRIIKDKVGICLFGGEPFASVLRMSNIKNYKYDWIWEKNRGSNFAVSKYQPMKEHESISVFSNKTHNYFPIKEKRKGGGASRVNYEFNPSNTGKRKFIGGMVLSDEKTKRKQDNLRYPSSIQKFNTEVGLHPTQKPVALLEYLIKTYTLENETVLDNCMGSGSTGVACINTNRNFIGIEKEDKYFDISKKRINEAIKEKNKDMFSKI